MALAGNRSLSVGEFLEKVKSRIVDSSWKPLLEDQKLLAHLESILKELHCDYRPKENGFWNTAPNWTDMFQWTSCPMDSVRAVVLAKESLDKNFYSFESTGYALGCRSKIKGKGFDLTRNSGLVNFLKILCQATGIEWDETGFCDRFRSSGFNPDGLSRMGILFFNVGLTMGQGRKHDVDRWWPFSKEVLRIVSQRATGDVPVLQLYRNDELDLFLQEEEKLGERLVLVGPKPWQGQDHVAFFSAEVVTAHAAALRRCTYEALDVVRQRLEEKTDDGNAAGLSPDHFEYIRLQTRLEPILWLNEWLNVGN